MTIYYPNRSGCTERILPNGAHVRRETHRVSILHVRVSVFLNPKYLLWLCHRDPPSYLCLEVYELTRQTWLMNAAPVQEDTENNFGYKHGVNLSISWQKQKNPETWMTTQTHNLELLGISSVYSSICLVCCSFVFTLVQFCLPDTGVELSVDEMSLFLAQTLPLNWFDSGSTSQP